MVELVGVLATTMLLPILHRKVFKTLVDGQRSAAAEDELFALYSFDRISEVFTD